MRGKKKEKKGKKECTICFKGFFEARNAPGLEGGGAALTSTRPGSSGLSIPAQTQLKVIQVCIGPDRPVVSFYFVFIRQRQQLIICIQM